MDVSMRVMQGKAWLEDQKEERSAVSTYGRWTMDQSQGYVAYGETSRDQNQADSDRDQVTQFTYQSFLMNSVI